MIDDAIQIGDRLSIPLSELTFVRSRAGGPGGQHVNKVSTQVTLYFDLEGSSALDDGQKQSIRERLPTRIGRDGRLRVTCRVHRSAAANRREAIERFAGLIEAALRRPAVRRRSRVPEAERRRRLEDKRRRGRIKRDRRRPDRDDG